MKVEAWMNKAVHVLTENDSLRDAILLSRKHQIRHIPIVADGQRLVGIVSDRDIKRFTPSILNESSQEDLERALDETTLDRIMSRELLTVSSPTHVRDAVALFCEARVGALPVVDDGKLVGILSDTDMLRAFLQVLTGTETQPA